MGTILLSIHEQDEIHQLVAILSGLLAVICFLILTPPLIKGMLSILFLIVVHKLFPTHESFE
ncbi:MAG: hypothetical protein ACFB4I_10725 [Cyanophyceae cyanobacterium]